jgi:SAM-dependent methyltransferase
VPALLAVLVGFVLAFPVQVDRSGSSLIYFGRLGQRTGLPVWVTLPLIFLAVAAVMAMVAQEVGRQFAQFAPLEAYRLDITGSLLGITAFSLISWAGWPPVAWGGAAAFVVALVMGRRSRAQLAVAALGLALLLGLLGYESRFQWTDPTQVSWSPYYKIKVLPEENARGEAVAYQVTVNGIPHQTIESVARRRAREPLYFRPYARMARRRLDSVLIVGAGNGADVAIALREGARYVDAVEIDPRILQLGRQLNPNHPYADPRVHTHTTDGRAFLERTHRKYDLILFALPDSLTLVAGQSSLRLESYLFTLQALRSARAHLAPGGVFGMYNYYRTGWLIDRLGRTLDEAFGRSPCLDYAGGRGKLALFTAGGTRCVVQWNQLRAASAPAPATDDYPFLYLRHRSIPGFYLLTLGLILAASLVAVRASSGPFGAMRSYVDLFFMGAAFLLLETKNVVQFALLFGTTWFVNALVFAGILVAVLLAVEAARHYRARRPALLYVALLAALAVAWAVPPDDLLGLSFAPRLVAAVAIAFAPVFLANLVFAERFRDVGSSTVAFGANLLGAMVGGLLEYGSLLIGYRALLFVVGGLYVLAYAAARSESYLRAMSLTAASSSSTSGTSAVP